MDTVKKFDGRAENYAAGRPGYSKELIDGLYDDYQLSKAAVIADIGSGTGKFAKCLLERQSEVYCVEPNAQMRRAAEKELRGYQNFHSLAGSAENTTLQSGFVDCITAAQAFHWFDGAKFKRECLRIIKSGGSVALIWNVRDESNALNQEWQGVFSRFCPAFHGFSNGIARDDITIRTFFDRGYDYEAFDYPLSFSREGFIKRSLSSSYSLKENDRSYEQYLLALYDLFDRYEQDGRILIPNRSEAYIGKLK